MCDQVSSSSTVEEVESNSNSDLGPLSLIRCSSPGSQRWFDHVLSELLEHHIPPNPASTPCHELNDFDISTGYPPVSFPEFRDDRRILHSQGPLSPIRCSSPGSQIDCGLGPLSPIRCSSPGNQSWSAYYGSEVLEHHIPPNPASTCCRWSYDVYLSFRGADSRRPFLSDLYSGLLEAGISTFRDDEVFSKGDVISSMMEEAIEESRVAIVVFSRNYASSRWCLDELVKILDCKEKLNQVVIPIYYDVDPSQVRKQTGCFGEALANLKERFGVQRMHRWTAALTEAASLSEWHLQNIADGVQTIVQAIVSYVISGQEGQLKLRKTAMRFEERIVTTAKSQAEDLRKISLKMLTVETESQTPVCDESAVDQFMQLDDESLQEEPTPHNLQSGEECALLEPFPQRSVTEHGNLKRKGDTGPSGQDHTIFELGNKQKMGKRLKRRWGIGGSISLENLKQHFGKKREEAAESLDVSISTFKRICRENGISRWPSKKIKRDRLLLSNLSSNGTVPVAGGAQIAISTTPTAFASTEVLVKSNQQKSRSSDLSLNNEIGTSLNDDVLRNNEGTDGENIMIPEGDSAPQEVLYKPQEFESTHDSLIPAYSLPDAPTILSPLPQERMQDKNSSGQLGEEIARQIEMTDGTSHLEKQYLGREILSCNTEKEVIVAVEESSSHDFRNDSEPIQEVEKNQLISMDDFESNRVKGQSTVESKSEPCIQTDARRMKLIFEKLIMLPLEDLTSPNHEASMKEALTILAGNLSLFTDEQAKRLLEFKFDFPTITYSWRDCSQSRTDCQNFLAEFEKTKSSLETATKEEEDLKDRYTQIENKEKEMMAQLEAIQKEKNEITEQRRQKINQTNNLVALAEDQAGRTREKELQMTIASAKLDKLKNQWVSLQSSFS